MSKTDVLEVEVDAENCDVLFRPLDRNLRGRLDFADIPNSDKSRRYWGEPIPGQRVGVNAKGEGYILEPVCDDTEMVKKAEEKGFTLGPAEELFPDIDADLWRRWIARLVDGGHARLVKGEPPKVEPIVADPSPVEMLAASTYAALTPEQRKAADAYLVKFRKFR